MNPFKLWRIGWLAVRCFEADRYLDVHAIDGDLLWNLEQRWLTIRAERDMERFKRRAGDY